MISQDNIINIGLLGNGGQADEIESYLDENYHVIFRAVSKNYLDNNSASTLIDIADGTHSGEKVIGAVGAPLLRKEMIEQWQGDSYETVIDKSAVVKQSTAVGRGSVIAAGAVITTNVKIGSHVLINIGASISHDSVIGDFVSISPGARIAGKVTIGDGVFVGIGAVISNGVSIAAGSVIGAGAVVLEDIIEENSVAVGVPAKVIKRNNTWLREV